MTSNKLSSVIIATGSYLPENIVTNDDLAKTVETSDEWIRSRTGIKQRHIAAENEITSDMAAKAAQKAINNSNISNDDIELIIVATTTPDRTFPSTAVSTQEKLGIYGCAAFDVQAVCSGFIYAISVADSFIKSGQYKNILVVGAEKMSSIVDWNDRGTCILFGDGAGAVILQASENKNSGIISTKLHADGRYQDILFVNSGVAFDQKSGTISMEGQEVFKHAVTKMVNSVKECLDSSGLSLEDVDFLVPHQANSRIIDRVGKKIGIGPNKVVITVDDHANTSAASIPLALDVAVKNGSLNSGDIVALTAIGGGLAWGSCILRWN